MADEERKILIDVEVESKDFDQEIGNVNKELEENKKLIRDLKKDYAGNATEIAKLEAKNRELTQSKRQLVKESETETKSLDALRLRLAKLTKERNSTNTSTEEGAARFRELQKEIKNTSDEISGFEEEGGDFRRNVGNYPELLDNATGGFVTLFKTLLANPIGIIIAALTGLVAVFAKSQTGAEFFRKTTAFLSTALAKLADIVEFVGGKLISAFEDPQQALTNLANSIRDNVIQYFTEFIPNAIQKVLDGFGLLGKAAKQLFAGDFSGALDTAKESASLLVDGMTDIIPATALIKAAAPSIAEFAREVNTAANAAFGLEEAMIANEKAIADLQVEVAKSKVSFIELKTASDDVTLSTQERIEAARAAFELENDQLNKQIALEKERIALLRAQNDLANSTEEDIQKVRDAEIQLATLQEASLNKQLEIKNKLNALTQQEATLKEQLLEREKAAGEDLEIFLLEQEGRLIEAEQRRREILLSNTELTENERKLITAESEAKITDIKKKESEKQAQIEKDAADLQKSLQQDLVNTAAGLFKEGTKAAKIAGLAQIAYSSGTAVARGIAASQSVPFPANLLALTATLAQVYAGISQARQLFKNDKEASSSTPSIPTSSAPTTEPTSAAVPSGLANVNASLLSQFGDGVRTNQQNNNDVVNGVRNLPPIYVAIDEVNRGQDRLAVKIKESRLG